MTHIIPLVLFSFSALYNLTNAVNRVVRLMIDRSDAKGGWSIGFQFALGLFSLAWVTGIVAYGIG